MNRQTTSIDHHGQLGARTLTFATARGEWLFGSVLGHEIASEERGAVARDDFKRRERNPSGRRHEVDPDEIRASASRSSGLSSHSLAAAFGRCG